MTEDEAKTKWCPHLRFTPETEGHHAFDNRGNAIKDSKATCIASACMAWRRQATLVHKDSGERVAPGERVLISKSEHRHVGEGFCGLAGALP